MAAGFLFGLLAMLSPTGGRGRVNEAAVVVSSSAEVLILGLARKRPVRRSGRRSCRMRGHALVTPDDDAIRVVTCPRISIRPPGDPRRVRPASLQSSELF